MSNLKSPSLSSLRLGRKGVWSSSISNVNNCFFDSFYSYATQSLYPQIKEKNPENVKGGRKFAIAVCLAWVCLVHTGFALFGAELRIARENEVSWTPIVGNSYQAQWSPTLVDAVWTDLGSSLAGSGSSQSAYDASMARVYRVMETVPASGEALVPANALADANPGFESGSTSWTMAPIHTISTSNPHSGTSSLRSNIPGGAVGGTLAKVVPSVVAGKSYTFSFYARQVSFGPSYVQQYRVGWVAAGGTVTWGGWLNFTGGNGVWSKVTGSPATAPGTAVSAKIEWYFATGAVAGAVGEVFLDDMEFAYQTTVPAIPAQTRQISSTTRTVMGLEWPSLAGVSYTVEQNSSLSSTGWSAASGTLVGTGGNLSHRVSAEETQKFFRVSRPIILVAAPPNIRLVPTGTAGSISLAWDTAVAPGVTGYRVLYGTSATTLNQSVELGLVQSITLPNLISGQAYYLTVVSLSGDGVSPIGATVLSSLPESDPVFLPLFSTATTRQPDSVVETSTAKITYIADRVRDRHAREANFQKYDHYLTFYWEQRVASIEIIDRVAKGGTGITFNYTTLDRLNPAEFRTFFGGITTVAQYNNNQIATLVSTNPSATPGETDYNYSATITQNANANNRALQIGDRVEVEISYFLFSPRNGRNNYYGTTLLYVVGEGIVPWAQANDLGLPGGVVGVVNQTLDSNPLPQETWLGGRTTLPYQYSNEPEHRFKQMAGNITPENGEAFMLGRRLHHTEFQTGAHSEAGNPVFTGQMNKVGPKFVAQSCVACHVNNGRSLLPAVGATIDRAVVKVGASADGTPHPLLGDQLQPYAVGGTPEAGVKLARFTETTGAYGDGTAYTLRKPVLEFSGVIPSFHSLRVAPQLIGLGLLEAVSESAVLALADPSDLNADGISGRVNYVPDPNNSLILRLGRFTPKANQSMVVHQIAYAFNHDMGVASALFPVFDGETSAATSEITATELDQMSRYVALLGVGAQRNFLDPEVVRGKQLFTSASCVACHTPSFSTSAYHPMAELRSQTIHPYTDLLLHDMGPGLADNMDEEGGATGAEWRTAPLWNIGLSAGVSGGEGYLHDGRARTIEEAILWHGGEATASKEKFRTMSASDRSAILLFLRSL